MEFKNFLMQSAEKINIKLSEEQAEKFMIYKHRLLAWNEKMNLTAITEEKEIIIKHFIDSLTCAKHIKRDSRVIDIGSGAGFPGIPLKILFQDSIKITLLDSLNKRVDFIKELVKELKLTGVEIIHGRAEDFGQNSGYREKYDAVVSRAVANMAVLLEYSLPFIRVGGVMVGMKGSGFCEELEHSQKAIEILGGKVEEVEKVYLPDSDIIHSIILINKTTNTPQMYPRKPGKPQKQPII